MVLTLLCLTVTATYCRSSLSYVNTFSGRVIYKLCSIKVVLYFVPFVKIYEFTKLSNVKSIRTVKQVFVP